MRCWLLPLLLTLPSIAHSATARAAREGAYTEWIPASVLRVGSDTLVVLNPGSSRPETLAVRSLGIVETEVHRRGRRMTAGLAFGAIMGVCVTGVIYGATAVHNDTGLGGIAVLGLAALIGGGVGLAVGAVPVRSWEALYVSPAAQRWRRQREWPYTGP